MILFVTKKILSPAPDPAQSRRRAGVAAAAAGILLNILLFLLKATAGSLSGSVAITADGYNNLADTGSCLIALLGILLSVSRRHPRLLKRAESFSGAVIAVTIIVMGIRTAAEAIGRIITPKHTETDSLVFAILLVTVALKGVMFLFYRRIGNRIGSAGMKAAAADSLSDCCATTAIILSSILERATGLIADGYAGAAASACIIWAGICAWRESFTLPSEISAEQHPSE